MPESWNAFSRSLQPFVKITFFKVSGTYKDFSKNLKHYIFYDRRLFLDALFLSSVYSGLKCCLSLLDTTGIRVPLCNFRNHSAFCY
jgi:hypothetical protein